ncbi:MAG: hypothetical protein FWJ66_02915 [Caldibacillus sp.]
MNRFIRRMRWMGMVQQYLPMVRRRRRLQLFISLLGLGLFSGATAYGLVRVKNNGGMTDMMNRIREQMANINMPKLLRTGS